MVRLTTLQKVIDLAQAIENEKWDLDAGTRSRYRGTLRLMYTELRLRADTRDARKLASLDCDLEAL